MVLPVVSYISLAQMEIVLLYVCCILFMIQYMSSMVVVCLCLQQHAWIKPYPGFSITLVETRRPTHQCGWSRKWEGICICVMRSVVSSEYLILLKSFKNHAPLPTHLALKYDSA